LPVVFTLAVAFVATVGQLQPGDVRHG
jgi:hypothetical protein